MELNYGVRPTDTSAQPAQNSHWRFSQSLQWCCCRSKQELASQSFFRFCTAFGRRPARVSIDEAAQTVKGRRTGKGRELLNNVRRDLDSIARWPLESALPGRDINLFQPIRAPPAQSISRDARSQRR